MTYCEFCLSEPKDSLHKSYHDNEYGFLVFDDNQLFERLSLEVFQAGLSWNTILKKRKSLNIAFHNFDIDAVALYSEEDIERILKSDDVIRHRKKIESIIYNANQVKKIISDFGSIRNYLLNYGKGSIAQMKKDFKFVGDTILKEFLNSTGYGVNPHDSTCFWQPISAY